MPTTLPDHMFDLRHIDRFLAEGKVTREQYDAWLASIEDSADNSDRSNVRFIATDRRSYGSGGGSSSDEG